MWLLSRGAGPGTLRGLSEPASSGSPPAGLHTDRRPSGHLATDHPDPDLAVKAVLLACSSLNSAFSFHRSPLCPAFYLKLVFNTLAWIKKFWLFPRSYTLVEEAGLHWSATEAGELGAPGEQGHLLRHSPASWNPVFPEQPVRTCLHLIPPWLR